MGSFQRFGSNPGGAGPFDLIAPTTVEAGNQVLIEDWGGTLGQGGANQMLQLEASIDGILWVEIDRMEFPTPGTLKNSIPAPGIRIETGRQIRVRGTQGTPGACSASLFGKTKSRDISDI